MAEKDMLLFTEEAEAYVSDEVEAEGLLIAKELIPGMPFGAEMLQFDDVTQKDDDSVVEDDTEDQKQFKPREHVPRVPKEESHWYRRCLAPEK